MSGADKTTYETSNHIVWILFSCLLCLILLLIVLYKILNKEANGEYTIRHIVYKEGGVRDHVRGVALDLGTRLGIQLWPHSDTYEDGEEMQEVHDLEAQVEDGSSQGSDTEGDDEKEENGEDNLEQCDKGKGGNTSDDSSSLEDSEAEEEAKLIHEPEAKEETEEKGEEKQDKVGEEQSKVEAGGGAGLLVDLKQFSGSAIWSEEGGGEGVGGDVTAL